VEGFDFLLGGCYKTGLLSVLFPSASHPKLMKEGMKGSD
jgi:hypothetical protein